MLMYNFLIDYNKLGEYTNSVMCKLLDNRKGRWIDQMMYHDNGRCVVVIHQCSDRESLVLAHLYGV